jgi:hypothetical protein
MKSRLLSCLCLMGAFAVSAFAAEPAAAPRQATTISKSAIKIGNGSFALVKGTKLEVLGREGDILIVKFRSMQGRIPLAETDYPADTPVLEASPATAATPSVPTKPLPVVAKPVSTTPAGPAAKSAAPPALSVDGKPATSYGKAVQKAKQVTEANKGTHVDPTKEIMDEQPRE